MKRIHLLGILVLAGLLIASLVLAAPSITLNSPENGTFYEPLQTITINYNVTDVLESGNLNCSLIIDGVVEESQLTPNGTFDTFVFSKSQPETYEWYVNCVNGTGTDYNTTNRTFTIDLNDTVEVTLPLVVNDSTLVVVGYSGKPGTVNLTIANDDFPSQRTNTTSTYSTSYSHFLGNLSVTQIYDDTFFRIEDNLGGNVSAGNYLAFTHNLENYTYYFIEDVYSVLDYYQINISPNMNQSVVVGEDVRFYDAPRPSGWFNVSVELYPGTNNASLYGTTQGVIGKSSTQSIFYDTLGPWYNVSNITGLVEANSTINFSIYDDYNVSLETLWVNITASDDANNFSIYTLENTLYNASAIDGNITCVNLSLTQRDCTFDQNLSDGTYNITFSVEDMFGVRNITTLAGYDILSSIDGVRAIQDLGTTLSNLSIYVNWTNDSIAHADYYELSVGNISGVDNVVSWFSVNLSRDNYTIAHENLTYLDWYFINIRVVDTLGRYSNVTSTDGITIEDNTPPINDFVLIEAIQNQWINDNESLTLSWNFTDNETPVDLYEYALGTQPYPLTGWDDTISSTNTSFNEVGVIGLSLEENETYYLSVKARNTNYFGGNRWSSWYSSSGVRVDTQAPANGYLSYSGGATYLNSIDLNFMVGNDSLSGIASATIYSSKASLTNGVCNGFSSDPARTINVTIIGSMTPQLYTYNNLDNGYCYRFELDVTDNAGNMVSYGTGGETTTTTIDTTPPSAVTITDEGYFSATSHLYFYWDTAVDAESGVSHYDYALGTAPGLSDAIAWTNHSLTTTLNLYANDYLPGHLDDEEIYYLSVRAWNAHNASLYSQSSSDGIVYFDFEAPTQMSVVSVAEDNTSNGWYDNSTDENISIIVYGESGLSCVWSYFDIDYIDDTADYATSCGELSGSNGYYNCSLSNITENVYDISIACQDAAGNKQTSLTNTDVTFYKDTSLPTITITSPNETIVPADTVSFIASINETSPYNITSELYNATSGLLVWSIDHGSSAAETFSYDLDFSTLEGEFNYYYVVWDVFNNTVNDSVYFIINHDEPIATINFTGDYITQTQDINIKAYLFNNITYSIYNTSGTQLSVSHINSSLQNKSEYNFTIDVSLLSDGDYTINVSVNDENTTYELTKSFILDTTYPYYATGSFEESPLSTIYEDDNITLHAVWNTELADTTMYLTHNATGEFENVSISEVAMGLVIYPNMHRYQAIIDSSSLTAASDFVYRWVAIDEAGNKNESDNYSLNIGNRAPNITTNTSSYSGLAGENFVSIIDFTDADLSQNNASFFNCSDNSAPFETTILSHEKCMLNWSAPVAGNYTFNVTISDVKNGVPLLNDTTEVHVEIFTSTTQNISLDSNTNLVVSYFLGASLISSQTSFGTNNIIATLAAASNYTVNINTLDEFAVTARNVSISSNATILTRKLNVAFIENETMDVGVNYRYIPHAAYVAEVNYTTSEEYNVTFFYENYSYSFEDNLQILKMDYDTQFNIINYSTLEELSTTLNETNKTASALTGNFSVFILVENQDKDGDGYYYNNSLECNDNNASINSIANEVCGNGVDDNCNGNIDEGCSSGGGGSKSSGGGSGSFIFSASTPTCEDGEQNGAETGVDCGGTCGSCEEDIAFSTEPSYCFNSIQDFDEDGVDCGGSCTNQCIVEEETQIEVVAPAASCYDGKQNGNEDGVDCGGNCVSCEPLIKEPVVEKPSQPEDESSSPLLFIIIGILVAGGILVVVMRTQSHSFIGSNSAHAVAGKISFSGDSNIVDDDIANIARYIEEQQENSYHARDIKNHLVNYGYSVENIEGAMNALKQSEYLETVEEYVGKYQGEGFSEEELQAWLLEKGINPSIVAIAMDRHRRKQQEFSF